MAKEKERKPTVEEVTDGSELALTSAIDAINKQFGKGAIMRLDKDSPIEDVEFIPTGSFGLDNALGVGGVPRGRIIEIFGPESSGKTTLSLQVIAEAQKNGCTAAFIDAEHALDMAYAKRLGVDPNKLLMAQPDSGEQALEIVETLVRSGSVAIIVVDSVAALTPLAEINGEMGDSHMGLQARLMSQALRKLTAITSKSNTTIIFVNQLRQKIGVMFGNPETTPGGNALKFYCSVRIDIRRLAAIKDDEAIIGNRVKVKVVKNKVAPPFKECEFDLLYGKGVNKLGEIVDLSEERGIIKKAGAWYSYNGVNIGQGRDKTIEYLATNEAVKTEIEGKLKGENNE